MFPIEKAEEIQHKISTALSKFKDTDASKEEKRAKASFILSEYGATIDEFVAYLKEKFPPRISPIVDVDENNHAKIGCVKEL